MTSWHAATGVTKMEKFRDFVPQGTFEKSVFAAAEEAVRFFAAENVGVWEILPQS